MRQSWWWNYTRCAMAQIVASSLQLGWTSQCHVITVTIAVLSIFTFNRRAWRLTAVAYQLPCVNLLNVSHRIELNIARCYHDARSTRVQRYVFECDRSGGLIRSIQREPWDRESRVTILPRRFFIGKPRGTVASGVSPVMRLKLIRHRGAAPPRESEMFNDKIIRQICSSNSARSLPSVLAR